LKGGVNSLMIVGKTYPKKTGFRHYLGGLLGESERKNRAQMANNSIGVVYNRLHHFIADSHKSCQLKSINLA
jgi:hypothetical protein